MDNWQPGDLALCISEYVGPSFALRWKAVKGGVYVVAGYHLIFGDDFLELEEDPDKFDPRGGWEPTCFRKIHPHTPDAEDRETIRLLNGIPVGEPA